MREIVDYSLTRRCVWLFDFDGTIADTEPLHEKAYRIVLSRQGLDVGAFHFKKYIGKKEEEIFAEIAEDFDVQLDAARLKSKRLELYWELVNSSGMQPYSYVSSLFDKHANVKKMILSSQDQAVLSKLLCQWGLTNSFSQILHSRSYSGTKHDELSRLASELKEDGYEIVHFEDSCATVRASNCLGNMTVYVGHTLNNQCDVASWTIDTVATQ